MTPAILNNRYRVLQVLGRGGFGETFLAEDSFLPSKRHCVLKQLRSMSDNPQVYQIIQERFHREAAILEELGRASEQVPELYAYFEESGQFYLVQEWIAGQTLAEKVRSDGLFTEPHVRQLLDDILPVLGFIHGRGIIHRDIKPDNVILRHANGKPVLIDFGLVKEAMTKMELGNSNIQQQYAQASIVGKYGYAPPEQIRLGQCYPCSDLYALGVCAVVLLTGKRPELLMDESLEWQWQSYVKISDNLTNILDKMLADKPKQRYQSAPDVLADLSQLTLSPKNSGSQPLKKVEININKSQKEQEVSEIIESEEFKLLEQQANKLRQKREMSGSKTVMIPQSFEPVDVASEPEIKTETSNLLEPDFLEHCRQELIRCIGPMGSLMLEDILDESPQLTPVELVEALVAEIPNTQRAEEFRKSIPIPSQSEKVINTRSVLLYPKFLEHCQQELKRCVGPLAMSVLEDILTQSPDLTPAELVEALVAEIPDAKRAENFIKIIKIPD